MSAPRSLFASAGKFGATSTSTLASYASTSRHVTRQLSSSSVQHAVTKFAMPAMSPTMTSGGIATWKVKEGQSFSAGDVLLEIETDKATMDVEAQDDGLLAKIVIQDGAKDVNVGKTIAMIAEEGDDISNVQVPADDEPSSSASSSSSSESSAPSGQKAKSAPQPSSQPGASTASTAPSSTASASSSSNAAFHVSFKGPLFPSVQRLLAENHIEDAESKIKGTGIRGMITKGDVLAFLGKAKSPTGTFREAKGGIAVLGPKQASPKSGTASGTSTKPAEPLSGDALRSLILGGLASSSQANRRQAAPASAPAVPLSQQALESALEGYSFNSSPKLTTLTPKQSRKDGIRKDDPLWDLI